MQVYKVKWKRLNHFFWTTEKDVVGHKVDEKQDKLVMYFSNGGLKEVQDWRRCQIKLGSDWVVCVKASMERQAGQQVPLATDTPQ